MNKEPLITVATITAVVTAILSLLAAVGLGIDAGVTQAIMGLVAVLAPLVVAYVARRHVTPVANPKDNNGSPLIPESDAGEPYEVEPEEDEPELVTDA